jgi:molybdopterin converting factor small subunit
MIIYFKAGTHLRESLKPDIDFYTRKVETTEGLTIREILESIEINPSDVSFAYSNKEIKKLNYKPVEGENITLQPPISGG